MSSAVYAEEFNLNDDNKASSAFVVDPDPLDPLPSKKESIKDGDEIVLDGIRDILDDKVKIESKKTTTQTTTESTSESTTTSVVKKTTPSKKKKSPKVKNNNSLRSDDPDLNLENTFHTRFQKLNIEPTSPRLWSQATSRQKMNVYDVQKNDTLFTISKILFGDSQFWPKIWSFNKTSILNPHYIYPGMKIYFYAGDAQNPPTLQLDEKKLMANNQNDNYFLQNTEVRKLLVPSTTVADREKFPSDIPDSLPLTRNNKYFFKDKKEIQVQLAEIKYNYEDNYTNPYVLSSTQLQSDFIIPNSHLEKLICNENQYISKIEKLNLSAVEGNYLIVKKLTSLNDRLKSTYKYKVVGDVDVAADGTLRINNCLELMDTDTLIVSQDKLNSTSAPFESLNKPAHLVDGLDFVSQEFFTQNQFVVINVEGMNLGEGTETPIYSDELGRNVGVVKILQLAGTLAIGVVTRADDIIRQGDRLAQ